MAEVLKLTCDTEDGDWLQVEFDHNDPDTPLQVWHRKEGTPPGGVMLTEDKVRELFNWLGVQLHRQGSER